MLQEDYVSFEVARLLEKKGMAALNHAYYDKEGIIHDVMELDAPEAVVAAHTLQMACKWLRKVYNLNVDVGYDDLDWFWNIISISEDVPVADRHKVIVTGTACHRTYEEACEAALKYVLENLI